MLWQRQKRIKCLFVTGTEMQSGEHSACNRLKNVKREQAKGSPKIGSGRALVPWLFFLLSFPIGTCEHMCKGRTAEKNKKPYERNTKHTEKRNIQKKATRQTLCQGSHRSCGRFVRAEKAEKKITRNDSREVHYAWFWVETARWIWNFMAHSDCGMLREGQYRYSLKP